MLDVDDEDEELKQGLDPLFDIDTAHIADAEFDKARGKAASIPPDDGKRAAGASLVVLQVLINLDEQLGLRFPDDTAAQLANNLKTVLLDKIWIVDEDLLKVVVTATLQVLDPATYVPDGEWKSGDLTSLRNVFLTELERKEDLKGLASRLRETMPKPRRNPPRLPSSQRK